MPRRKKPSPAPKAARIRGEIWKGNFSIPRIIRRLKRYNVTASDVTSEMSTLRKQGVIFPGHLLSEGYKAALIRREFLRGEFNPAKIAKKFAKRGVTTADVSTQKIVLRKHGVIIPKSKGGGRDAPIPKAARIRREIVKTIFRPGLGPKSLRDPRKRRARLSPQRIAKKLGVNESDVTSEMTRLKKLRGMKFPTSLSNDLLIDAKLLAGEYDAETIVRELKGFGVTNKDVSRRKVHLRKKGEPIPVVRSGGAKRPASKRSKIRNEFDRGNFDVQKIAKKLGVTPRFVYGEIYRARDEGRFIPRAKRGRKPKPRVRKKR